MQSADFEIKVKIALIKKKMTQTQLARELGITNSYLCDILKGNRKGSGQKEKITKLLDIRDIPKLVWRELVPVCRNAGINQILLH